MPFEHHWITLDNREYFFLETDNGFVLDESVYDGGDDRPLPSPVLGPSEGGEEEASSEQALLVALVGNRPSDSRLA